MRTGSIWALIVTALLITGLLVSTGAFSFFIWALALNGFMGQERAVNASMITFVGLAGLATLTCVVAGLYSLHYLSVKRSWKPAGGAMLSIIAFTIIGGGLQLLSVLVSVIVASQMRTTR